jgi:polyisoprenoid-binding protein YceI
MSRYRIVPERSRFWAEARSSLHPIRVDTKGFEGYIEAELTDGHLNFDVPFTAQVELDTELLKTGNGLYDRELERRLEVRKYPRIRGTVRKVKPLDGGNRLHVVGELSFHGKRRSVEGEVTLKVVDANTIVIEGQRVFDMRDYGLDPPRILMLQVYPDVRVRGKVVAQRET